MPLPCLTGFAPPATRRTGALLTPIQTARRGASGSSVCTARATTRRRERAAAGGNRVLSLPPPRRIARRAHRRYGSASREPYVPQSSRTGWRARARRTPRFGRACGTPKKTGGIVASTRGAATIPPMSLRTPGRFGADRLGMRAAAMTTTKEMVLAWTTSRMDGRCGADTEALVAMRWRVSMRGGCTPERRFYPIQSLDGSSPWWTSNAAFHGRGRYSPLPWGPMLMEFLWPHQSSCPLMQCQPK